jgi:predicted alpha/beta superfamily hydrolase
VPAEPPTHFLYAQDGQNLFGPGVSWHLQDGAGPRTLLVGIDSTRARWAEYTHVEDDLGSGPVGGDAIAYVDFLRSAVRPFVEARYGTPSRVGILGSSLGGLVSYYAVLRSPGEYDFVASLSGTMGWGSIGPGRRGGTILEAFAALPACPGVRFYLDSGGAGADCADLDGDGIEDDVDGGDNYCENVQLRDVLQALGCTDVHHVWAPNAPHHESAWWGRAPAILDLFEAL